MGLTMLTSILISSCLFVVNSANEVEAVPEKSLDNALQADAGSYLMDHIGKIEAAVSDNSKSLSSIRQAVEANTKVEAPPGKSLDNALQADAGSEIMKHLAMMELSNIRQAVEAVGAVEANTKVEAVPETIHYNKIQADIGDDLMKRLAKIEAAIKSNTEKFQSITEKIQSNTEKIGSVESRMITCQVGVVNIDEVPQSKWTKEFPIELTGFKKKPGIVVAMGRFLLRTGGTGVYLSGEVKSPTSAVIKAYGYGGPHPTDHPACYVHAAYVACGN